MKLKKSDFDDDAKSPAELPSLSDPPSVGRFERRDGKWSAEDSKECEG